MKLRIAQAGVCIAICLMSCIGTSMAGTDSLRVTVAASPRSGIKTVQGQILIAAPPRVVWQQLTNYPAWQTMMPGYEKSSIIRNTSSGKMLDVVMKVAGWLPSCHYQVQVTEYPGQQVTFQRVSGDFESMLATYRLSPQNGGENTLLSYTLQIDIGSSIPGVATLLKGNTEKSLRAVEHYSTLDAAQSAIGQR